MKSSLSDREKPKSLSETLIGITLGALGATLVAATLIACGSAEEEDASCASSLPCTVSTNVN
jgi:hypothetical protein